MSQRTHGGRDIVSGGIEHLVLSGPLVLAAPVALAAGAVTFISPCCLPLVPGYLSYVTGMSGADAQQSAAGAAMRAQPGRAPAAGVPAGPGAVATFASPPAAPAGAAAATRAARGRTVAGTALFVLGFSADRKSTRLNSSHEWSSYAVFCLKKHIRVDGKTEDPCVTHSGRLLTVAYEML